MFEADSAGFLEGFLAQNDCWVHQFEPVTTPCCEDTLPHFPSPEVQGRFICKGGDVVSFWEAKILCLLTILKRASRSTESTIPACWGSYETSRKTDKKGLVSSGQCCSTQVLVSMTAVRDFGFELVHHPSYSPDFNPSDYDLLFNMKKTLGREPICS